MTFNAQIKFCLLLVGCFAITAHGAEKGPGKGDCSMILADNPLDYVNTFIDTNDFMMTRDLAEYNKISVGFQPDAAPLARRLAQAPEGSIWLNLGAGLAIAEMDAMDQGLFKGKILSLGAVKPFLRTGDDEKTRHFNRQKLRLDQALEKDPDSFSYLSGGYIEERYLAGELDHLKGRISILTDVAGPAMYVKDFRLLMEIALNLLQVGGTFEFLFGLMGNQNLDLEGPEFERSNIFWSNGREMRAEEALPLWLNQFQGAEVLDIIPGEMQFPHLKMFRINGEDVPCTERYLYVRLRKISADFKIPPMVTTSYRQGRPPRRTLEVSL
jgi:hypothetical protein